MVKRPYVSLFELFAESPTAVVGLDELDEHAPVQRTDSGREIPNSAPISAGTVIADRYEVEAVIGEGGMGRVYRVRHVTLGKRFALKLMHDSVLADPRARELFYREARLASSLSHPNIVSVVDFGEDPQLRGYMVMELVDGAPLLDRLNQGNVPLKQGCEILLQVAEALHYVHQRDIIHSDIKPENILLCEGQNEGARRKQTIKLLDFGLARLRTGASSKRLDGTPDYMAPEKILGKPPHPSMDVYGLGVLGYALLAGRLPFEGTVDEVLKGHVHKAPSPPSVLRGEPIDERAEALIMKALAKDPDERQKDMAAFIYEVKTLMDMLGYGRKRGQFVRVSTVPQAEGRMPTAALVFDLSPMPLAAVDIDGSIVIANRAFAQFLTGDADAGMAGQDLMATRLSDFHPGLAGDLRKVHVQGEPLERKFSLKSKEGAGIRMVLQLVPGQPGKGDVHLAIYASMKDDNG